MRETLQKSYEWCKTWHCDGEELNKYSFLMEHIFNVATYDTEQDEIIGRKIIEVVDAITNRKTFEYIKDDENTTWYLTICNLPFFQKRLSWGSSIRGAWWDSMNWKDGAGAFELVSCGLIDDDGEQKTEWMFSTEEWDKLMQDCVEFVDQ